jgi:hypothetical protein
MHRLRNLKRGQSGLAHFSNSEYSSQSGYWSGVGEGLLPFDRHISCTKFLAFSAVLVLALSALMSIFQVKRVSFDRPHLL